MSTGDGVEVAIKMQIDVFHRDHLSPASAGSTTLHTKAGPQGRLPQTHGGTHTQPVEAIVQPYTGGGLTLPCRGWRDGRHQYQFASGCRVGRIHVGHVQFCLVMAKGHQTLRRQPETLLGQQQDRLWLDRTGNLDIRSARRRKLGRRWRVGCQFTVLKTHGTASLLFSKDPLCSRIHCADWRRPPNGNR